MPTYHYRCAQCAHEFDQFQKFSEDPMTECPACQGTIKRVIGPVGVVFKGSGWYITDSRGGTKENGASAKASSSTDAASNESTPEKSTDKPVETTAPAKSEAAPAKPTKEAAAV